MIITGLISVILDLFGFLLGLFPSIPAFPDSISSMLSQISSYIVMGGQIINAYCYGSIVAAMLTVVLAVWTAYHVYQFIMFVIKKIPMLGIE